jgi:anti-anti-sigma regulatory factor
MSPDLGTVDALARLQLAARRLGFEVRLCGASREVVELVELAGLGEVLRVEARWQPEEREESSGIEEERELGDPPA